MIGIYITPDFTQVVKAKEIKNKNVSISFSEVFPSYWDSFVKNEPAGLSSLFKKIDSYSRLKYEDVYIVLPDIVFSMVQCFEYTSKEGFMRNILSTLPKSEDKYFISTPLKTTPVNTVMMTVYAIEKSFINTLIEAAKLCKFSIYSVEPSSAAFFRAAGIGRLDVSLIEIFNDYASIIAYSPIGGIFRYESPSLSYNELKNYQNMADRIFGNEFLQHSELAEKTFKTSRIDSEFIIIARRPDQKWIYDLDSVRNRALKDKLLLPRCIEATALSENSVELMSCIGTMLQDYDLKNKDFYNNPELMLPPFVEYSSANLLPEYMKKAVKSGQWIHNINKACQVFSSVFLFMVIVTGAATWYFSSIEVPDTLEAEHAKLQKDVAAVKKEIDNIKGAERDNQHLMERYQEIVECTPEQCHFTSLSLGSDLKKADPKWIVIKTVSNDELIFQSFLGSLSENKNFSNPTIDNIVSNDNGVKTAGFNIGNKPSKKPPADTNDTKNAETK